MQRIENAIIVVVVIVWIWFLTGCESLPSERQLVNYDVAIVELDQFGKKKKVWIPEPKSVYIYTDTDVLIFKDAYTGDKQRLDGSYKFLSNTK